MTKKFHERFEEVEINYNDAITNTLNRFVNMIFDWPNGYLGKITNADVKRREIESYVVSYGGFGKRYFYSNPGIANYLEEDNIHHAMKIVEGFFNYLTKHYDKRVVEKLSEIVGEIIELAEVDISLRWEKGVFRKKGAELLDDELVDNSLNWLKIEGFETVYGPYNDSLGHLLHSNREPDRLHDGISNAFEALEGMAKIICGNDKILHANCELFISKMNVTNKFRDILKGYIDMGNQHRHSGSTEKPKPNITEHEVESFIYLTGVFLRLAMATKETWLNK